MSKDRAYGFEYRFRPGVASVLFQPPAAEGEQGALRPGRRLQLLDIECELVEVGVAPVDRRRRLLIRGRRPDHRLGSRQNRRRDRKSTRLNSSHSQISYAVFCLKKKTNIQNA